MTIDGSVAEAGTNAARTCAATLQRIVDQRLAVDVKHVEEEGVGRRQTADRLLEDSWLSGVVDTERLAIQHDGLHRQPSDELDNSRQAGGDVVQASTEETHIVATLVSLHTDAVEFPLHARHTDVGDGLGDAGRRSGQHRLHGRERGETDIE